MYIKYYCFGGNNLNIGSIIKYHRTMRSMTQSELCNGICSVSHLSKIENNNKEVDGRTLELLLEKLELSKLYIEESYDSYLKLLEKFLQSMIYYEKNKANSIYTELLELEPFLTSTDLTFSYHLYKYRYYLLIEDLEGAQQIKTFLSQFTSVFSQHESDLFNYLNALLYLYHAKYSDSLEILTCYAEDNSLSIKMQGEVFYYLSLTYSYLENSSMCVVYAEKAFQEYSKACNYIRQIHTQLLLSIHKTEIGLYSDAEQHFEHMLRNAHLIGEVQLLPTIYHNYAILLSNMKEYDQAMNYFRMAMEGFQSSEKYYVSLSSYTEILLILDEKREAFNHIREIISNTGTEPLKKYNLIFTFHLLKLENKEKKAIKWLENQVIPYLEKKNLMKDFFKYVRYLAEYYSDKNKEKALFYYVLLNKKEERF